jgi:hypothetical protein
MEGLYVKAHVGKKLRQYLLNSYQNGIITPPRDSALIGIIKPHLELSSEEIEFPDDEIILIELPVNSEPVYHHGNKKVYFCNTLWRNTLSELGHRRVKQFFENFFKHAFRIYMDGYYEAQGLYKLDDARMKVKDGVVQYLMQYHIDFDEKLISALTRDWWRHRDLNENYKFSPLVC